MGPLHLCREQRPYLANDLQAREEGDLAEARDQ
jgi:hypothetical protein